MRSSNFCLPLTLVFRTQVLGRTRVMNIYSMIRHVNNNALHNKYLNTSSIIAVLLCRLRERETQWDRAILLDFSMAQNRRVEF